MVIYLKAPETSFSGYFGHFGYVPNPPCVMLARLLRGLHLRAIECMYSVLIALIIIVHVKGWCRPFFTFPLQLIGVGGGVWGGT